MDRFTTKKSDAHLPPEHRRVQRYKPVTPWDQNSATVQQNIANVQQNTTPVQQNNVSEEKSRKELERQAILSPQAPQAQTAPPLDEAPDVHQDSVVFVRGLISQAIESDASDIHLEPKREKYSVRIRVDGVLQKVGEGSLDEYTQILNTVKVLGDMNIAEHTIPQDGHIELMQQQEEELKVPRSASEFEDKRHYYDIRVSIFPSVNGEVAVMRILNRENALLTIEQLGMDNESLEKLHEVLLTSYGMILITGPTGSGKTTTLYSVMSELRDEEKNIITLEDPIEFHLDWLRQCEIRTERGFTFERAMESVLRQDPDVLMVGEIRDLHTAEHAVRSALVGRIVGSTIHANTTIGTIARLIELGISRSIIGHTLNAIIAQRLVRKNCDFCKVPYEPEEKLLQHFKLGRENGPFYKGKGCKKCTNTGFKGRIGIFSLMTFDTDIRNHLFDQRPLVEINELALRNGMKTLRDDAVTKVLQGMTTVEEASRII